MLLAGGVVVWALLQVSLVVVPLLIALILASALTPVVDWLGRRGWPRLLSTVALLLGAVALLSGVVSIVVVQVSGQWQTLADSAVEGADKLVRWWNETFPQFSLERLDPGELWADARGWLESLNYGALGSGLASGIGAVGSVVVSIVLCVVILFFFLKDGPRLWAFLISPLRGAQHRRAELMGQRAVAVLGGYVRGTVIVALVDAVFIGLGLVLLGIPLALPLALIVFVCAFIPVVGATLAGVIAALVALVTNGFWPAVIVVIIVVLVNQLEGNFLQPVVLGKSLALHELVVLVALTVGTVLGGIIGTLIAVPLTAVAWALIKGWNEPLPELEADADDTLTERWRLARERAFAARARVRGGRVGAAADAEALPRRALRRHRRRRPSRVPARCRPSAPIPPDRSPAEVASRRRSASPAEVARSPTAGMTLPSTSHPVASCPPRCNGVECPQEGDSSTSGCVVDEWVTWRGAGALSTRG